MDGLQSVGYYEQKYPPPYGWSAGTRTLYHVRVWWEPNWHHSFHRPPKREYIRGIVAVATNSEEQAKSLALSGICWGETRPWRFCYDIEEIGPTRLGESVIEVKNELYPRIP